MFLTHAGADATIDCSKSGLGKIHGTFVKGSGGNLKLGDSEASLCSLGTNLHALRRIGVNGKSDVGIYRMHDTPNGIADIISESEEVNKRKSSIIWHPNQPRRIISGLSEDIMIVFWNWAWLLMVWAGFELNLSLILF